MTGSGDDPERHDGEQRRRAAICHPLRRRIALLLAADEDREAGAPELAEELGAPTAAAGYHLRVLAKHEVIEIVPDSDSSPPLYRWSPGAAWARELLEECDE